MEFTPWPKTPRLFRDAIITEKIDGTNAAVVVENWDGVEDGRHLVRVDDGHVSEWFAVGAQSRTRIITPDSDNFGFARWVETNALALATTLGPGTHFGEWWGNGIQRGYGLEQGDKRFSLFNVHRYSKALPSHPQDPRPRIPGLGLVPVLDTFTFDTQRVQDALWALEEHGSQAAPGFMRPEGVIVFHSASRSVYKALIENDDQPKGAS